MKRGNKLSTEYRVLSNLNAVPDGVPNGVFSIYLFRSAILTARRLFRTDKTALQGKRYNRNPLRRRGGTSPKGEGAEALENGVRSRRKRYPRSGIQPLSQNLRFCQLPLHRGAERHSVNATPGQGYNPSVKTCGFASSPCTGEPRFVLRRLRCEPHPGEAGIHAVFGSAAGIARKRRKNESEMQKEM